MRRMIIVDFLFGERCYMEVGREYFVGIGWKCRYIDLRGIWMSGQIKILRQRFFEEKISYFMENKK